MAARATDDVLDLRTPIDVQVEAVPRVVRAKRSAAVAGDGRVADVEKIGEDAVAAVARHGHTAHLHSPSTNAVVAVVDGDDVFEESASAIRVEADAVTRRHDVVRVDLVAGDAALLRARDGPVEDFADRPPLRVGS